VPATILAVDTATERCSVALAHGGRVDELVEAVGQKHSERVLPMIQALLEAHRLRLADCDAIAFGAGPGAFTGLRIACGVAQGLAFGCGKPIIAIGNLQALAFAASRELPSARRIVAAIDARMQEIYWAAYSIDTGAPTEVSAPSLAAAADLPALCRQQAPDLLAGNALRAFPAASAEVGCAMAPDVCASAADIATLALSDFAAGRARPAAQAAPIYVRDRVALTIEERRAVAARA
jgi:tRNA threonylcarbamoyladenosine biosynthesis protein TsaB